MALYLPEDTNEEDDDDGKIVVTYQATQEDEEKFFLMYHMNIQPSECDFDAKDVEKRKWLLARFITQKEMEKEAMAQQRIAQNLNLGQFKV